MKVGKQKDKLSCFVFYCRHGFYYLRYAALSSCRSSSSITVSHPWSIKTIKNTKIISIFNWIPWSSHGDDRGEIDSRNNIVPQFSDRRKEESL